MCALLPSHAPFYLPVHSLSNARPPSPLPAALPAYLSVPPSAPGPEQTNSGEGTRQAGGGSGVGGQGAGHKLARRPAAKACPEAAVKEGGAPQGDGGGQGGRLQQGCRRTNPGGGMRGRGYGQVSFVETRGGCQSIETRLRAYERRCFCAARTRRWRSN